MAGRKPAYDAAREPSNWLKLDEEKRLELVLEYHEKLKTPHPEIRVPRIHAAGHVIVETQIASGDPPAARKTLDRLVRAGLGRHEALHAICDVVYAWTTRVLKTGSPMDMEGYSRDLEGLAIGSAHAPMPGESPVYDALKEPQGWLEIDEGERHLLVLDYHEKLRAPHPDTPSPHLHAVAHVIVESQLAAGNPPQTRRALERLMKGGIDRHEALHAIGSVVFDQVLGVMQDKRPADSAEMARELDELTVESWRAYNEEEDA